LIAACIAPNGSRPKPLSASPASSFLRVPGSLYKAQSRSSSLKKSGSAPNRFSRNCAADIGRRSALQKLWTLLLISPKTSPILYSMVCGPLARCLKSCS
jgi:hypothetical protein